MALRTTFICPYCFETHKISDVQFRCTNKRCNDISDIEKTCYENMDVSKPIIGKPAFRSQSNKLTVPKSSKCPFCKKESRNLICPSCHNNLPESVLLGEDKIITVVGACDTGKTHFLTVFINELEERIANRFDGALESFDDSWKKYFDGSFQKLYMEKQTLAHTNSSLTDVNNGAYKPQIFTLKMNRDGLLGPKVENHILVFFDTAGVDLNDEDTMNTVNKYISRSSGIIFLLDPLQMPAVRNQLDENVIERSSSIDWRDVSDPDDILTRISNLIRKDRDMRSEEKIDIPVAAAFSKFDVIASLIPEGSIVLENSPHCAEKTFNLTDWHNVNNEVKSLLVEWGDEEFLSQMNSNYSDYSFFAISALGMDNSPREDGRIDKPRPHRIEDPLLWILKENGVIESKE